MSEHLAECLYEEREGWVVRPCICRELRAYGERVLAEHQATTRPRKWSPRTWTDEDITELAALADEAARQAHQPPRRSPVPVMTAEEFRTPPDDQD